MVTPLYSAHQVEVIDAKEVETGVSGIELMKRAGRAAFEQLCVLWPDCDELIVVCGVGNNAGDGYVIAQHAVRMSLPVTVLYMRPIETLKGDARRVAAEAAALDIPMYSLSEYANTFSAKGCLTVIVDALLGTGFKGKLKSEFHDAITWINNQRLPVYAIDVPSGVSDHADNVAAITVNADATISFIGRKMALFTGAGKSCSGKHVFCDLEVSKQALASVDPQCFVLQPEQLIGKLGRHINSHKGSHGHVAVVGGGEGSVGAGLLAAEASIRSGSGLTSLFTNRHGVVSALSRVPEVMATDIHDSADFKEYFTRPTVICVGPGLGLDKRAAELSEYISTLKTPMVIDADALTLMAQSKFPRPTHNEYVLTPHPGEAARMLGVSASQIQQNRWDATRKLSQRYGGVVVLKGAGTLVSDGKVIWVCDKGNPAMAVGGMGDVLSGVVAALLAQGLSAIEAAQLGVWVHSYAADVISKNRGEIGLLASDLVPVIRSILNAKAI